MKYFVEFDARQLLFWGSLDSSHLIPASRMRWTIRTAMRHLSKFQFLLRFKIVVRSRRGIANNTAWHLKTPVYKAAGALV
jgi:hypothetical protein